MGCRGPVVSSMMHQNIRFRIISCHASVRHEFNGWLVGIFWIMSHVFCFWGLAVHFDLLVIRSPKLVLGAGRLIAGLHFFLGVI